MGEGCGESGEGDAEGDGGVGGAGGAGGGPGADEVREEKLADGEGLPYTIPGQLSPLVCLQKVEIR